MMHAEHSVPDNMMGVMFAFEGLQGSMTVMNAPTGCKYYPASVSDLMFQRELSFNPLVNQSEFFFGQSRVPCTYLDSNDYIMGTKDKVRRVEMSVKRSQPSFIGFINSPGASLIGEDLMTEEGGTPTARVESPGYSETLGQGFQRGMVSMLESLCPPRSKAIPHSVNLLGLSIWHLGWRDSLDDLKALLGLCGADVICTPGSGWTVEDASSSVNAELNVVLDSDFGDQVAGWYEKNRSIPSYTPTNGSPLGFEGLGAFCREVCQRLELSPLPALDAIRKSRSRAYREISRLNSATGLPKGRTFSVRCHASLARPIVETLHSYLGMVPLALDVTEGDRGIVDDYLEKHGLRGTSEDVAHVPVDIHIGDGNTIASLIARGITDNGLDVSHPGLRSVMLRPEPVLGLGGTMRLLDRVLNSLSR